MSAQFRQTGAAESGERKSTGGGSPRQWASESRKQPKQQTIMPASAKEAPARQIHASAEFIAAASSGAGLSSKALRLARMAAKQQPARSATSSSIALPVRALRCCAFAFAVFSVCMLRSMHAESLRVNASG